MDKLINKVSFSLGVAGLGTVLLILGLTGKVSIGKASSGIATSGTQVAAVCLGIAMIAGCFVLEVHRFRAKTRRAPRDAEGVHFYSLDEETGGLPSFAKGAKRIQLTCRTGVNLITQYKKFLEELGRSGCELDLLFVDPSSPAASQVYGPNTANLFQNNIVAIAPHLKSLKGIYGDRLRVKKLNYLPTTSVMLIQNTEESFVRVTLYFMHARVSRDRPIFRLSSAHLWYNCFVEEVTELWKNGQDWTEITTPRT